MRSTKLSEFEKEISQVINRHGLDSLAGMPDYILASYVTTCIAALKTANREHDKHKGETQ